VNSLVAYLGIFGYVYAYKVVPQVVPLECAKYLKEYDGSTID
jgi:hypothetical protein